MALSSIISELPKEKPNIRKVKWVSRGLLINEWRWILRVVSAAWSGIETSKVLVI